jgi:hypothetical protein
VEEIPSDDRIADLGSGFIIAFITGLVIPKTPNKYRFYVFTALMILTISFGLFSHWKGWLIYNYWNNYLTILRYAIPFFILIWYDRWQWKNLTVFGAGIFWWSFFAGYHPNVYGSSLYTMDQTNWFKEWVNYP